MVYTTSKNGDLWIHRQRQGLCRLPETIGNLRVNPIPSANHHFLHSSQVPLPVYAVAFSDAPLVRNVKAPLDVADAAIFDSRSGSVSWDGHRSHGDDDPPMTHIFLGKNHSRSSGEICKSG